MAVTEENRGCANAEYKCGKFHPQTLFCILNMRMEQLRPLLGTTLILVAHPDDEVIGFGAIMQKMQRALVVFATDGAPHDPFFWKEYGSRQAYAEVRRQEAKHALSLVGAEPLFLSDVVPDGIADQRLFCCLPEAADALEDLLLKIAPDCLLTLSYEGGHPDHDSACFLASVLGRRMGIPVWEGPLYHRNEDGSSAVQTFPQITGKELEFSVEESALAKKIEMFHAYKSQKLVLDGFRPERECLRPIMEYDFTRPPLPWKLNYEYWQWSMTGPQVAKAFHAFLQPQGAGRAVSI
jgi:LmbE family N-acetylglucosaminyl deacetylase